MYSSSSVSAGHVPAASGLSSEVARFLETCTHVILCERGIYPPALFEPRHAYGLPATASRHPMLNAYISQMSESVKAWLVAGSMQRVVLAVLAPPRSKANPHATPRVLERFVFELCLMSPDGSSAATAAGSSSAAAAAAAASAPLPAATVSQLHSEFASVLLRLTACNGHFTAKRPPDCTWSVLLYTNQSTPAGPPSASPLVRSADAPALRWQQVPLQPVTAASAKAAAGDIGVPYLDWPAGQSRIMSLRSVRLPLLHMEVYAEAGEADVAVG